MNSKESALSKKPAGLLNQEEFDTCSQVAALNMKESSRAAALLQLHAGETQQSVAEQTGLSPSQVHYLRKRFLEKRLAIFPAPLLADLQQKKDTTSGKLKDIIHERKNEPIIKDDEMAKDKEKMENKKEKAKKAEKKDKKAKSKKTAKVKDIKQSKKKNKKTKNKKQDKKKDKKAKSKKQGKKKNKKSKSKR